jgi:hypothetical protein
MLYFYGNFAKIGKKILLFSSKSEKSKKLPKWPINFIPGKLFQKGQMATLGRERKRRNRVPQDVLVRIFIQSTFIFIAVFRTCVV